MSQASSNETDQAFSKIMAMRSHSPAIGESINAYHMPDGKFYRSEAHLFSEFHILISGYVSGSIEPFDSIEQAKRECDGEIVFTVQGRWEFHQASNPTHDIADFTSYELAQQCSAQLELWSSESQAPTMNR